MFVFSYYNRINKKEDNEKLITLSLSLIIFVFNYSETTVKGISTDTSLCNLTVAL